MIKLAVIVLSAIGLAFLIFLAGVDAGRLDRCVEPIPIPPRVLPEIDCSYPESRQFTVCENDHG